MEYEHLLAGLSGGLLSTFVVHPLDFLKIRYVVDEGNRARGSTRPVYRSYLHLAVEVVRARGVRGLYQGATPNIIANTVSWGLYFYFYNTLKSWMQIDDQHPLSSGHLLAIGCEAGVVTLAITNPIWVTKTRLCLQYENQQQHQYRGMLDVLVQLYRRDGIRGWYKGFLAGAIGTTHGAVQFMTYEKLKQYYTNYAGIPLQAKLGVFEYFVIAASSKCFAAASTYPYQVVRTRLQDQHAGYSGYADVVKRTWKFEGLLGFYKGLFPSLLRVMPATAVTFIVYENVKHYLQNWKRRT